MEEFSIVYGREASEELLAEVIALDRKVYPEKYQTILENAADWFKKNREIFTYLRSDGRVIGYICILPLQDRFYNEIKRGRVVQDVLIPEEEVRVYEPGKTYNLYIFSVVLHPDYQGRGAIKVLLNGMVNSLLKMKDEGVEFGNVLADAVSPKGEKLVSSLGLKKVHGSNHESVIYEASFNNMLRACRERGLSTVNSYPKADLYLFLPCSIEKQLPYGQDGETPAIAKSYVEQLDIISAYEFDSSLTRNIKRSFLDQVEVVCETDDFECKRELGRQKINLLITWHTNTGIAVVTVAIPSIHLSITHLLDQMSRGELYIYHEGNMSGKVKITDWLEFTYGLAPAGTPRACVNLSGPPQSELEMLYLLASEAIGNTVYGKITGENFKKAAKENVAQYEYSEIYVSENCAVQIFKEFPERYELRLTRQLLTVFSIELILFQDAAISRVNRRAAAELEKQQRLSSRDALRIIEDLSVEFARTIVFWDLRNYRYETTQAVADSIARAFRIKEQMEIYKENKSFLEHLITIRSARMTEKENRSLNTILVFLTVCQVAPIFYSIIASIQEGRITAGNYIAAGISAGIFIVLLLVYRWINRKRR